MNFSNSSIRILTAQGWIFLLAISMGCSQPISRAYTMGVAEHVAHLLRDHYVFEEVGEKAGAFLIEQVDHGMLDTVTTTKSMASRMTEIVQSVSHDKHMRVTPARRAPRSPGSLEAVREVSILEGNIGYVDLRGFPPTGIGRAAADEAMKKITDVKAIIFDLRRNGGGSPEMVQYWCSYFFSDSVHLNSLYYRDGNETREFWTVPVNGKKLPEVLLYILTSQYTFSGGEEFCYNMQTRKRAMLIGETTGGGANPGDVFTVNDSLDIFVPTGRAINPITKTNWEGVGVRPDILLPADAALERARDLAAHH